MVDHQKYLQPNLISSNLKEDAKSIKKNVCIWFLVLYKIFYPKIAPSKRHMLVGKRAILKFLASVWLWILWNLTKFQLIQIEEWNKSCLNEFNQLNLFRFHKFLNQTYAEKFSCLSWKIKKMFYSWKIYELRCSPG